jgi:hypothetical protein
MPPVEFEPTFSAGEWPQTYALDRAATGTGKHIQFIVKNTFKATCFGTTEPSSGLFVRTDPNPITSTFGIPSVYSDGIFNAYDVCCFFLFKI